VHAKDVDSSMVAKVQSGRLTYTEAVAQGMYRPLGAGDVDVTSIVRSLSGVGYTGWYVLEQGRRRRPTRRRRPCRRCHWPASSPWRPGR
jgi:sugar phosphate isomerase/epimerase